MKPVVASVNWPWAVCLAKPLAVRLINMEKIIKTIGQEGSSIHYTLHHGEAEA